MQLAEKSISRVTQLRKPQKYALVFFHIPKCWPWGKSPPGIVHLEESDMKKKLSESTYLPLFSVSEKYVPKQNRKH